MPDHSDHAARHRPDRGLLHHDLARPARAGSRAHGVLADGRSAGAAFRCALGHPRVDHGHQAASASIRTPTWSSSDCPTTCTRRRSRPRPPPASRCCAPSRSAGTRRGPADARGGRARRRLRAATSKTCATRPRRSRRSRAVRGRRDRRRHLGALARNAPRAALGVVLGRPADRRRGRSSTWAATASRSSATSSARATGRSR